MWPFWRLTICPAEIVKVQLARRFVQNDSYGRIEINQKLTKKKHFVTTDILISYLD